MKKIKIVSGLMALAMSVSVMGITASAADPVKVTVGKETVQPGESFSVDVDLSSVASSGLTSIDFAISYDASVISISDVTLGAAGNTGASSQEGEYGDTVFGWKDTGSQIVVVWSTGLEDSNYWVKNGTFVTITGKANASAKAGDASALTVVAVDRAAYPGGAANSDIVFSAVAADNTVTNYGATGVAGEVKIAGGTTTEADWGDADCNGSVDVLDAVMLARVSSEDTGTGITAQGKLNADVTHDDSIKADDLAKLLKYLAGKLTKDDLAK
ncbi:MAG: Cohesin domain protein [Oscillospiraceae bacterium]|nr:Cohesin domain protein [Oscillospiraceae bacterium]